MKTPREILFKRHEAAESSLDAIRKNVVAEQVMVPEGARPTLDLLSPSFLIRKLWRELIWPCRHVWVGMAAVWVAIIAFAFAGQERGVVVAEDSPPAPEVKIALKERRQMMAQLLDPAPPAAITTPRNFGPRSEQQQTTTVV